MLWVQGRLVASVYYDFIEDFCPIELQQLNYPAYSVGKDGKMGYVARNGEIILDCIYKETFGDLKNSIGFAMLTPVRSPTPPPPPWTRSSPTISPWAARASAR